MADDNESPKSLVEAASKVVDPVASMSLLGFGGAAYALEASLDMVAALGPWDFGLGVGLVAAGAAQGCKYLLQRRRTREQQEKTVQGVPRLIQELRSHNRTAAAENLELLLLSFQSGAIPVEHYTKNVVAIVSQAISKK